MESRAIRARSIAYGSVRRSSCGRGRPGVASPSPSSFEGSTPGELRAARRRPTANTPTDNPGTWQDRLAFVQANEVSGAQRVLYQIKGPVSAPAANERW